MAAIFPGFAEPMVFLDGLPPPTLRTPLMHLSRE